MDSVRLNSMTRKKSQNQKQATINNLLMDRNMWVKFPKLDSIKPYKKNPYLSSSDRVEVSDTFEFINKN